MANFNKVLSFFLGLVVVVVFVIVLSNRLNISNKIIPFSNIKITKKVTPTPVKKTSTITQKTTKEPSEVKFTQPAVVNQQTKGGRSQNNRKKSFKRWR